MNKQEVYSFLEKKGIECEITEHIAVFTMDEAAGLHRPHPLAEAKNLFVRDDKKKNYYLITVQGEKKIDLKAFRHMMGTRPLSFASSEDLANYLGLTPGSVSPFGLLNEDSKGVKLFLDEDFFKGEGLIGIHPNDNTGTVYLKAEILVEILEENGTEIEIVKI